jgi:hypothetical protein
MYWAAHIPFILALDSCKFIAPEIRESRPFGSAPTSQEVRAAKEVLLICQRVLEAAKERGARWHFGVAADTAE